MNKLLVHYLAQCPGTMDTQPLGKLRTRQALGISDLPFPSVDMSSTDHLAHNRQGFEEDKIMAELTPLESEPPRSCSTCDMASQKIEQTLDMQMRGSSSESSFAAYCFRQVTSPH